MENYFKMLGLSVNASAAELKKAYRKLVKEWHPDRFQGDLTAQAQATEKFRQINEAYQILSEYIQHNNDEVFENKNTIRPGIKIEKVSADFYYNFGVERAELGEEKEALEAFTQAIRCDDSYLKAYQYRGFLLEKMGLMQRAQADFKKIKEIKLGGPFKNQPSSSSNTHNAASTATNDTPPKSPSSPKNSSRTEFAQLRDKRWESRFISNADIVTAIAINSSGKLIAAGYENHRIYLWDQQHKKHIISYRGHTKKIRSITFSVDHQRIYSAGNDHQIRLHSLDGSKTMVLGGSKHQHSQPVTALVLSQDGSILVSGSADKTVKIWFLTQNIEPITLSGFASEITALAISPDSQYVAIASLDNNIRLRRLTDGKLLRSIPVNGSVASLNISPDGRWLAMGGFNHEITIWNLETGENEKTLQNHTELVSGIRFLPDSRYLLSTSWDGSIKLWHLDDFSVKTIGKHQDAVLSCDLSIDGKVFVTGGRDKRIGIWTQL